MVEKTKSKLGRTPLPENERLVKKITVNFTEEEFAVLTAKSKEYFGISLPKLIRALLKKQNII